MGGPFASVEAAVARRSRGSEDHCVPFLDPSLELTERSAAQTWADAANGKWTYDHTRKCWFRFSGSHWEQDTLRLAFHDIGALCNRLGKGRKISAKRSFALGAEAFAQADPRLAVNHSIFDQDIFLLGTPGGTVDCRTGQTMEPDPRHFISKRVSVRPELGDATLWLKCLEDWTQGDEALISYLQRICGYCLTGSTQEHALFSAIGAGKNGKSTFLNTIRRVMGDYACTAPISTFVAAKGDTHPTDQAMLVGARLVTASETEEGRSWAEAKVKHMTGGDPVTARFMRQDFFTYTPQFKLFIVGNHMPQLHNVDEATRRRFNIITFDHVPPAPDPELEAKLAAEHGRILSWMIRGCLDWRRSGLCRPDVVNRSTEDYFDAQDLLGQWISERCETGAGLWELPAQLYRDWSTFAQRNGENPGTSRTFYDNLPKRGFPRAKTGGLRMYRNISLKKENE